MIYILDDFCQKFKQLLQDFRQLLSINIIPNSSPKLVPIDCNRFVPKMFSSWNHFF